MLIEPSDLDVMRLIAYVSPIDLPEDEDDYEELKSSLENRDENPDEYLIDFVTVNEAIDIGTEGLLNKVASTLVDKDILKHPAQSITWRLVGLNQKTPNEKKMEENYQVTDLRLLH
jgi:hypothetical protein